MTRIKTQQLAANIALEDLDYGSYKSIIQSGLLCGQYAYNMYVNKTLASVW